MTYRPDPEFQALYAAYTSDPESIGSHLNRQYGVLSANDPLLVTTGSDLIIFPGDGRPPLTQSFRTSTRGFFELTGVSHLGVAVPYLIQLRDLGFAGWEADARRLMMQAARVRKSNTFEYWRDTVAVEAWSGLEHKIVDLVDYSCAMTLQFLERGLADPSSFTHDFARAHFLDAMDPAEVPVPMNDMMAATFALNFLDTAFRVIRWLRSETIDWNRMMVIVSGRAGRATAGVTWQTNSMCHLLWQASGQRLDPERLMIAPHAPALAVADLGSSDIGAIEAQFRGLWFSSQATVEMGRIMYRDYPAFRRTTDAGTVIDLDTESASTIPVVRSADDRRAIITRLRFVMEDPAQQLANAGAQFIVDQLCSNGNRPDKVVVPGFTGTTYPVRP